MQHKDSDSTAIPCALETCGSDPESSQSSQASDEGSLSSVPITGSESDNQDEEDESACDDVGDRASDETDEEDEDEDEEKDEEEDEDEDDDEDEDEDEDDDEDDDEEEGEEEEEDGVGSPYQKFQKSTGSTAPLHRRISSRHKNLCAAFILLPRSEGGTVRRCRNLAGNGKNYCWIPKHQAQWKEVGLPILRKETRRTKGALSIRSASSTERASSTKSASSTGSASSIADVQQRLSDMEAAYNHTFESLNQTINRQREEQGQMRQQIALLQEILEGETKVTVPAPTNTPEDLLIDLDGNQDPRQDSNDLTPLENQDNQDPSQDSDDLISLKTQDKDANDDISDLLDEYLQADTRLSPAPQEREELQANTDSSPAPQEREDQEDTDSSLPQESEKLQAHTDPSLAPEEREERRIEERLQADTDSSLAPQERDLQAGTDSSLPQEREELRTNTDLLSLALQEREELQANTDSSVRQEREEFQADTGLSLAQQEREERRIAFEKVEQADTILGSWGIKPLLPPK